MRLNSDCLAEQQHFSIRHRLQYCEARSQQRNAAAAMSALQDEHERTINAFTKFSFTFLKHFYFIHAMHRCPGDDTMQ